MKVKDVIRQLLKCDMDADVTLVTRVGTNRDVDLVSTVREFTAKGEYSYKGSYVLSDDEKDELFNIVVIE